MDKYGEIEQFYIPWLVINLLFQFIFSTNGLKNLTAFGAFPSLTVLDLELQYFVYSIILFRNNNLIDSSPLSSLKDAPNLATMTLYL